MLLKYKMKDFTMENNSGLLKSKAENFHTNFSLKRSFILLPQKYNQENKVKEQSRPKREYQLTGKEK